MGSNSGEEAMERGEWKAYFSLAWDPLGSFLGSNEQECKVVIEMWDVVANQAFNGSDSTGSLRPN